MKVGFVGLGAIGLPIAQRLAEAAPVELSVFDLSAERMAAAAGSTGRAAGSITDAVAGADLVMTVLPADRHVRAVAEQIAGASQPGMLYVDCSTIRPSTIVDVAGQLARLGVHTTSVALTRGAIAARAGSLALYVGDDDQVPSELDPVFAAMADEIRLVPGLGAAKAVKIANNMVMSGINVLVGDAAAIAACTGAGLDELAQALSDNDVGSWVLSTQIRKHVLQDDLGPQYFSSVNMLKDVSLYLDLVHETGASAILAAVAAGYYRGLIAAGRGQDYHPAVVPWLIEMFGGPAQTRPSAGLDSLQILVRAIAAAQTICSVGPLQTLARIGLTPSDAVANLRGATGDNSSLDDAAAFVGGHHEALDLPALAADLSAALDLAGITNVPALAIAAAQESAYELDRATT